MRGTGPARDVLDGMIAGGEACRVEVEGAEGVPLFALAEVLQQSPRKSSRRPKLFILSPFDSAVSDRHRGRLLFDFDYSLESYTPAAKRKYGYFCLPVLWGDRFIARVDAKADRKHEALLVHKIIFEPRVAGLDDALAPLASKLQEFARFNGCDRIEVAASAPKRWLSPLRKLLRK